MLEKATTICGAKFGTLFRYEDELFYPRRNEQDAAGAR